MGDRCQKNSDINVYLLTWIMKNVQQTWDIETIIQVTSLIWTIYQDQKKKKDTSGGFLGPKLILQLWGGVFLKAQARRWTCQRRSAGPRRSAFLADVTLRHNGGERKHQRLWLLCFVIIVMIYGIIWNGIVWNGIVASFCMI